MDDVKFFQNWNISFAARLPLTPSGSPNRSVSRFVAQDRDGRKYIAEGFELRKKSRQIAQTRMLEHLQHRGLAGVFPYLRTSDQAPGVTAEGCFWQLRLWQEADTAAALHRREPEKFAGLCAAFLLKLREISLQTTLPPPPNEKFSFGQYLPKLSGFAARKMAFLQPELQEICAGLDKFLNRETSLPAMFAHGDFHPGNILMSNGKIQAVIDWEFAGIKFPGYDMALLIGCLAMDDPDNLDSPAVRRLQDLLYRNEFMPDEAWEHLPQMIAATRLGWLGEWLSLDETALVKQEMELLAILLKNFTC